MTNFHWLILWTVLVHAIWLAVVLIKRSKVLRERRRCKAKRDATRYAAALEQLVNEGRN